MKPQANKSSSVVRQVRRLALACALLAGGLVAAPGTASAQIAQTPPELEHVGVREHLDEPLPLATKLRDHTGKSVELGSFFDGKRPVVLTFAYHSCPVVCSMILDNEAQGLKGVGWTLGQEYDAITISIDPNETLEKTAAKRRSILGSYGRSQTGWHFLVGDEPAIRAITSAAGFEAQYDPDQKQWAHPSVVMVVTPDGKMARYLYGLEFSPSDLKLALLEASQGRSISTIEQIILYCYHYDPKGGKYVLVARRVMQVGGGAVAVVLFGILGTFWAREIRRARRAASSDNDKSSSEQDSARTRAEGAA